MALYDVGERVVLSTELRDSDGILINADVVLTVRFPSDATQTPTLSNPSTGKYSGSLIVTEPGDYTYVWSSSGAVEVVDDGGFSVVPAGAGRKMYCTTEELRAHLGDSTRRNLDETELRRAILASSRAIDKHTGSFFWRGSDLVTKYYDVHSATSVDIQPIATLEDAAISIDPSGGRSYTEAWTVGTEFEFGPENQDLDSAFAYTEIHALGRYLPRGRKTLRVTGYPGYSAVPDAVREACVIKSTSLFKRGDSPFGIAGSGDFGFIRVSRFEDPDVVKLLDPYVPILMGII